jgi:hypothetical protein
MFDTSQLMAASGGGFYNTTIDGSLRFNDDDSASLSWTPASAGNRKTWTWSAWVKRSTFDRANYDYNLMITRSTAHTSIGFTHSTKGTNLDRRLFVYDSASGMLWNTAGVQRDTSAWYHIVVSVDTTQATSTNRLKVYINGIQQTNGGWNTYPTQNTDTAFNSTQAHYLGRDPIDTSNLYDGYLTEVNFIDGTALDATSFGEFKSGVWIPKAYSGSYGTNGFYLDFDGTYYNDKSGNGNNWTANNLAATDVVLDSPTNNFATLNPLDRGSNTTLSEGNLKYTSSASDNHGLKGTMALPDGKWYFETLLESYGGGTQPFHWGIAKQNVSNTTWVASGDYVVIEDNGNLKVDGSSVSYYGGGFAAGDIISIAVDVTNNTIQFYKNNTGLGSYSYTIEPNEYLYFVGDGSGVRYGVTTSNFGQDSSFAGNKTAQGNTDANGYGDFYYAPPSGYLALCTANLPDPVASIDPAQDGSPQDHFNTVLWTATNAYHEIRGVGFKPDFVWGKKRSSADSHVLVDAVRGSTKELASNSTAAEYTNSNGVSAFVDDGFNLVGTGSGSGVWNGNAGATHVAWNWKANGSGVSNTDGSITSTVSANTDAGFSIVSWTYSTSNSTVGHGLDQAPEMWILRSRDAVLDWLSWHENLGSASSGYYLKLNGTNAVASSGSVWGGVNPTSTTFGQGSGLAYNGDEMIAYCFHSVEGFSKFGSYTGNGSSDGPFVYTGFRPAFVMVKSASSSGYDWWITDAERNTYNVINYGLRANSSAVEVSDVGMNYMSNGFKYFNDIGAPNRNGVTYIYMAFAENPFKYANAR